MDRMPNDPVMLLSLVNMKLRDRYASLEALCEDLSWEQETVCQRLEKIRYAYSAEQNQFI